MHVPEGRLGGDIAFLELPGQARHLPATLESGFTLVGWTGTDGLRVSRRRRGCRCAGSTSGTARRSAIASGIRACPRRSRDDFPLEYGAGLWVDLRGSESVTWFQR